MHAPTCTQTYTFIYLILQLYFDANDWHSNIAQAFYFTSSIVSFFAFVQFVADDVGCILECRCKCTTGTYLSHEAP